MNSTFHQAAVDIGGASARGSRFALSGLLRSPIGIVFLAGLNLILIQWVLVREMTTMLLGTELVVLLISTAYFVGLSVGYLLAGRLPRGRLAPLGTLTLILHLTLPVWFRLLVTWLDNIGAYGVAFIVLPLLTPFVVSAFYSLFLPLFADSHESPLPVLYGVELLGSAAGVMVLVIAGGMGLSILFSLYAVSLLVILLALRMDAIWVGVLAALSVGWMAIFPGLNAWSNSQWYEAVQNLPDGTITLFTGYSPYQKVDALQSPDGARYLYLDGLLHFGTGSDSRLNVVSGQIPAALVQPEKALVFGAGSMEMAALIADSAGHVRTVELDPMVVEASRRYFLPYNRLDQLTNRDILIDDAKHYIANSQENYDFIATDLPAAYSIQTATLYSAPFFAQVAHHLNPGGVFVANLTSEFTVDDIVSRRIAAGLLTNFDAVIVVTPESVGWSFAFASDDLPFDVATLSAALSDSGEAEYVVYDTAAVRAFVGDAPPITLDSMDIVLHISADWIASRLD